MIKHTQLQGWPLTRSLDKLDPWPWYNIGNICSWDRNFVNTFWCISIESIVLSFWNFVQDTADALQYSVQNFKKTGQLIYIYICYGWKCISQDDLHTTWQPPLDQGTGLWAVNCNPFSILHSTQVTNLHMSRQLSCRGMRKIVTWSVNQFSCESTTYFSQDLDHNLRNCW